MIRIPPIDGAGAYIGVSGLPDQSVIQHQLTSTESKPRSSRSTCSLPRPNAAISLAPTALPYKQERGTSRRPMYSSEAKGSNKMQPTFYLPLVHPSQTQGVEENNAEENTDKQRCRGRRDTGGVDVGRNVMDVRSTEMSRTCDKEHRSKQDGGILLWLSGGFSGMQELEDVTHSR